MSRIRFAVLSVVFAAFLAVVPLAGARTATSVKVTMKEFKFVFSTSKVKAGAVTFQLVNKGKLAHDLKIAGKKSALIQPGKTGSLKVTLKKGKYPYLCTVPGHAAAGMKGTLTVS